jgi:hypothetical protein
MKRCAISTKVKSSVEIRSLPLSSSPETVLQYGHRRCLMAEKNKNNSINPNTLLVTNIRIIEPTPEQIKEMTKKADELGMPDSMDYLEVSHAYSI